MASFFATTAKHLEPLLEAELRSFGATKIQKVRAGVAFEGDLELAYRACLWSRVASRILLPLRTFPAPNPEKLYGGTKGIKWSDHLGPENTLAVDFSTSRSAITHTQFGALKVKDAIVDQIRSNTGDRPSIDTQMPDIRVNVYVLEDQATVSLDLAGSSLHLRGYRDESTPAPLKENLAAALLLQAGWPEKCTPREGVEPQSFFDPMCGSGTLPIEAALIASDTAPGLLRRHWGFSRWRGHDAKLWDKLIAEAQARRKEIPLRGQKIVGYDVDPRAIRAAIANSRTAGVERFIHFEKRELNLAERPGDTGVFMANPPYGERLGEVEELKPVYKHIGDVMKKTFKGWTGYILTGSPDLAKSVGLAAKRKIPLFNGAIECRLLEYELYDGTRDTRKTAPATPAADAPTE